MSPSPSAPPLPPGRNGLPLLGETLAFAQNIFGFIHQRTLEHGPLFRTRILGKPTVFISGPQLAEVWLDTTQIERQGGFPSNIVQLFGGSQQITPLLDGEVHRKRKGYLLAAFTREATASYLPLLQGQVEALLARWAAAPAAVPVTSDLKQLAVEAICGAVLGIAPGPKLDALMADYNLLFKALGSLPIKLPGTAYSTGLKACQRILAVLRETVAAHQQAPSADGLSRILAAAKAAGDELPVDVAALEMHHFVLAGVIIFAELVATLRELKQQPQVCQRLTDEVKRVSPSGPVTPAQLRQMPYLMQVVNEVKRTCPNVPMSFGRAKETLTVNGFTIPKGWLVMMAVVESNLNPVFTEPAKFDPERFNDSRAEDKRHPHAFMPQGAGELTGHKCAGYDFSTALMQLFAVLAVRSYTWELPPQDLSLNWKAIPPEHRSGLLVRFTRAA